MLGIGLLSVKYFLVVVPCLLCVAFFTLLERKILGIIGLRFGPWKVRVVGLLQPISDAGKLLNKESNSLSQSSFLFYYISSVVVIFLRMFFFFLVCFDYSLLSLKIRFLVIFLGLSVNSLNSIFLG